MAALGLLLATLIQPTELPLRLDRDVVTIGGKHYGLMPPEYVAGKGIVAATWQSGSTLAVIQDFLESGAAASRLVIYRAEKRLSEFYRLPAGERPTNWVALDDGSILVQTSGSEGTQVIDASELGKNRASGFTGNKLYRATQSKLAVLSQEPLGRMMSDGKRAMAVIDSEPVLSPVRLLWYEDGVAKVIDSGMPAMIAYLVGWPGSDFYLRIVEPEAKGINGRLPHIDYAYVPASRGFRAVDRIPYPKQVAPDQRDAKRTQLAVLRTTLECLYVAGDKDSEFPSAIVAGDATDGEFSIEGRFVRYRHGGHLFVRELRPITSSELEQLRSADEAKRLLTQAKQIGVGLAIYCADNKDVLPGRNEKVADLLLPYLKDGQIMQGFVYTYEGGIATNIAEPTQTVLGYVQGKYGRAVVYADSHCRWEPRKP